MHLLPALAGADVALRGVTADLIDQDITDNGTASIATINHTELSAVVTAAGLDPNNLSSTNHPYVWNALRWSILYEHLQVNYLAMAQDPDCEGCEDAKRHLEVIGHNVCHNLNQVNLSWDKYCKSVWSVVTHELITGEC